MPENSSRAEPSAMEDFSPEPAPITTPEPNRKGNRLFSLRIRNKTTQFAARLKANLQWHKRFLRGKK